MNDARSPHRPDYRLPVFARKNPQVTVLTLDEAVSQIGFLKDAPTLGTSTLDWDTINHRLIPWESENQISQALTEILAPHQDTQILLIRARQNPRWQCQWNASSPTSRTTSRPMPSSGPGYQKYPCSSSQTLTDSSSPVTITPNRLIPRSIRSRVKPTGHTRRVLQKRSLPRLAEDSTMWHMLSRW